MNFFPSSKSRKFTTYIIVAGINSAILASVYAPVSAMTQSAIFRAQVYHQTRKSTLSPQSRSVQDNVAELPHVLSAASKVADRKHENTPRSVVSSLANNIGHVLHGIIHSIGTIPHLVTQMGRMVEHAVTNLAHQAAGFVSHLGSIAVSAIKGAIGGVARVLKPNSSVAYDIEEILQDAVTYEGPAVLQDIPLLVPPIFHNVVRGASDGAAIFQSLGAPAPAMIIGSTIGGVFGASAPIFISGAEGVIATAKAAVAAHTQIGLGSLALGALQGAVEGARTELLPPSAVVYELEDIAHNLATSVIPAVAADIPHLAPIFHYAVSGASDGAAILRYLGAPAPVTAIGSAVGGVLGAAGSVIISGLEGAVSGVLNTVQEVTSPALSAGANVPLLPPVLSSKMLPADHIPAPVQAQILPQVELLH